MQQASPSTSTRVASARKRSSLSLLFTRRWLPFLLLPASGLGQHADSPGSGKAQQLCGHPSHGEQEEPQPSWGGYAPAHSPQTGAPKPSPHGYSPPSGGNNHLAGINAPGLTTSPEACNNFSVRYREETAVAVARTDDLNLTFPTPPPYAATSIDLDIPASSNAPPLVGFSEAAQVWSPCVYRKRKLQLDSPLWTHVAGWIIICILALAAHLSLINRKRSELLSLWLTMLLMLPGFAAEAASMENARAPTVGRHISQMVVSSPEAEVTFRDSPLPVRADSPEVPDEQGTTRKGPAPPELASARGSFTDRASIHGDGQEQSPPPVDESPWAAPWASVMRWAGSIIRLQEDAEANEKEQHAAEQEEEEEEDRDEAFEQEVLDSALHHDAFGRFTCSSELAPCLDEVWGTKRPWLNGNLTTASRAVAKLKRNAWQSCRSGPAVWLFVWGQYRSFYATQHDMKKFLTLTAGNCYYVAAALSEEIGFKLPGSKDFLARTRGEIDERAFLCPDCPSGRATAEHMLYNQSQPFDGRFAYVVLRRSGRIAGWGEAWWLHAVWVVARWAANVRNIPLDPLAVVIRVRPDIQLVVPFRLEPLRQLCHSRPHVQIGQLFNRDLFAVSCLIGYEWDIARPIEAGIRQGDPELAGLGALNGWLVPNNGMVSKSFPGLETVLENAPLARFAAPFCLYRQRSCLIHTQQTEMYDSWAYQAHIVNRGSQRCSYIHPSSSGGECNYPTLTLGLLGALKGLPSRGDHPCPGTAHAKYAPDSTPIDLSGELHCVLPPLRTLLQTWGNGFSSEPHSTHSIRCAHFGTGSLELCKASGLLGNKTGQYSAGLLGASTALAAVLYSTDT